MSLSVKFGALAFVLAFSDQFAINLQLLVSLSILQTFPAIGLYTRWTHRWALFAGWAAGMVCGTWLAYGIASSTQPHFGGPLVNLPGIDAPVYIGLVAFALNLLVAVVLTVTLRAAMVAEAPTGPSRRTTTRWPATPPSERSSSATSRTHLIQLKRCARPRRRAFTPNPPAGVACGGSSLHSGDGRSTR